MVSLPSRFETYAILPVPPPVAVGVAGAGEASAIAVAIAVFMTASDSSVGLISGEKVGVGKSGELVSGVAPRIVVALEPIAPPIACITRIIMTIVTITPMITRMG